MKAEASGNTLSYRDTEIVRGMLVRGDRQHDIAAYFGVNGGRISDVSTNTDNYPTAKAAPGEKLPPSGPYLTKYALNSVIETLNEAISAIELAEEEEDVEDVKAALILAKETIQTKLMP